MVAAALIAVSAVQLAERDVAKASESLTAAPIAAYPTPPGLSISAEVTVTANGTPIEVESLRPPYPANAPAWFRVPETENLGVDIVRFSCDGPSTLAIHLKQPAKSLTERPRARQIQVHGGGADFTLALPGPCKLLVEIDGRPPLAVLADPPQKDIPRAEDVTHYFGPGEHTPGVITLNDNDRVYLAAGAIVYGGFRGGPHGAKIYGRGILDGSRLNGPMVSLNGASRVEFEGILMRCGRGWQNTLRNCDDVRYRNVKVFSFVPSGDGLDPVSSRTVRIEDCFFRCSDDCIAIKAMRRGPKVADIAIRDCVMAGYAFADGVTVGFEAGHRLDRGRQCEELRRPLCNGWEPGRRAFRVQHHLRWASDRPQRDVRGYPGRPARP